MIHIGDFRDYKCPKEAAAVFVDPPYSLNKNYNTFNDIRPFHEWVIDIFEWSINVPWILIIGPYPTMREWLHLIPEPHRILIWHRTFTLPGRKIKEWPYSITPVLVYRNNGSIYYGKGMNERSEHDCIDAHSMLGDVGRLKRIFGTERLRHPAATGTSFPSKVIPMISQKGDLIVDPMCGLGGILVAGIRMNRKVFGIELDPHYADMARKWIEWEENNQ